MPYINQLKIDVFGNNDVVLHETELRLAIKDDYKEMRKKEKRDMFWERMGKLFNDFEIKVFNVVIIPEVCKKSYDSKYLNNEYCIALQIIIENYAHYLEKHNGIGSICIESRNPKEDNRLQNHYNSIKKHGTLFLNNYAMRNCITTLSFSEKCENIIGLQLADFIPNTLKKHAHDEKPKEPNIIPNICKCLYDGCNGNIDRFSNKKIM